MFRKATIFFLVIIFICMSCAVKLDSQFDVEWDNENEKKNNIRVELVDSLPRGNMINNFDVRNDGVVALVFSDMKHVAILDDDGSFLYGFKIQQKNQGSVYVEWNDDTLNLLTVRGDCIYSLNDQGEIIGSGKLTQQNWYETAQQRTRVVNGNTYTIRTGVLGIFCFGYAEIEKQSTDGVKTTFYKVSVGTLIANFVAFLVAVMGAIVLMTILYTKLFQKNKIIR